MGRDKAAGFGQYNNRFSGTRVCSLFTEQQILNQEVNYFKQHIALHKNPLSHNVYLKALLPNINAYNLD